MPNHDRKRQASACAAVQQSFADDPEMCENVVAAVTRAVLETGRHRQRVKGSRRDRRASRVESDLSKRLAQCVEARLKVTTDVKDVICPDAPVPEKPQEIMEMEPKYRDAWIDALVQEYVSV